MHILLIPSWYPTDQNPISGIFFREQALALARHDIKIGVVAPHLRSLKEFPDLMREQKHDFNIYDDVNVKTYRLYNWNWSYKLSNLRQKHWLKLGKILFQKYIINEGVPDLIHAHCAILGGILASEIKKEYNIPFVITEHSTEFARGLVKGKAKEICSKVYQEADTRMAVSPSLASLLSEQFMPTPKSWKWVPNLLDQRFEEENGFYDEFINSDKQRDKKASFRFLNIAILSQKKGQIDLIEAFEHSFKANPNVELFIGGDGKLRNKLENIVHRKGLQSQIKFLGKLSRNDVKREILAADVFVLSSHHETFGVVLIEALACGKPVIATKCGGPECIISGKNGLLVEPKDISAIGNAMLYMKKHLWEYNSVEIRKACINRFGQSIVANKIKEVYLEVLR